MQFPLAQLPPLPFLKGASKKAMSALNSRTQAVWNTPHPVGHYSFQACTQKYTIHTLPCVNLHTLNIFEKESELEWHLVVLSKQLPPHTPSRTIRT